MFLISQQDSFVDINGDTIKYIDVGTTNINAFSIEYVKRKYGADYIMNHIFESKSCKSSRQNATADVVSDVKGALDKIFSNYCWSSVRQSLNQSGLDMKKKLAKNS